MFTSREIVTQPEDPPAPDMMPVVRPCSRSAATL
jgi:hypothetical protein